MQPTTTPYILLADDDEEDQELLKEAIIEQSPEMEVAIFGNGEQVLAYLEHLAGGALPGLIILDYKMPVLSGIETLERLYSDPRYTSIPVAVWSTSNQHVYQENSLKKGAVRYFTKPNSATELKSIAAVLLSLACPGAR